MATKQDHHTGFQIGLHHAEFQIGSLYLLQVIVLQLTGNALIVARTAELLWMAVAQIAGNGPVTSRRTLLICKAVGNMIWVIKTLCLCVVLRSQCLHILAAAMDAML